MRRLILACLIALLPSLAWAQYTSGMTTTAGNATAGAAQAILSAAGLPAPGALDGLQNLANAGNSLSKAAVGLGLNAGRNFPSLISAGLDDVAIGANALGSTGLTAAATENVAVGNYAMGNTTTGWANVGIGSASLRFNTTGYWNTAVGTFSQYKNTSGIWNVGLGFQTLYSNSTGQRNSAVGTFALYSNTLGVDNVALGMNALQTNTDGNNNTGAGANALYNSGSTALTLGAIVPGSGYTNGTYNNVTATVVSGPPYPDFFPVPGIYPRLNITISGGAVTAVTIVNGGLGVDTTTILSAASADIGGTGSGFSIPVATDLAPSSNSGFGGGALGGSTTASENSGFGAYALTNTTVGNANTAAGTYSEYHNLTGTRNAVFGYNTLFTSIASNYNTVGGSTALYDLGAAQTAGAFNVGTVYTIQMVGTTDFTLIGAAGNAVGVVFTASGVGTGTGTAAPNADNNTALGYNTGRGITYGINNTILGAGVTGLAAGLSDAIILATGEGTIRADFGKTTAGVWTFPAPNFTGLTQGSALFAGASGALSQDNANFFWDGTNHRLGLGTTSPLGRLHVLGSGTGVSAAASDVIQDAVIEGPNVAAGTASGNLVILSNSAAAANAGGMLGFGGKYSGNNWTIQSQIKSGKDDGTTGVGAYLSFLTRPSGGSAPLEIMRITSLGGILAPSLASSSAATTGTLCWTTGTGNINVDTTVACLASDERLKNSIVALKDPLAEVARLQPITYRWNDGTPKADNDPGEHIGLGAFATAYVDERLIARGADGSPRGWRQDAVIGLLVGGVQQLNARLAKLEAR